MSGSVAVCSTGSGLWFPCDASVHVLNRVPVTSSCTLDMQAFSKESGCGHESVLHGRYFLAGLTPFWLALQALDVSFPIMMTLLDLLLICNC